MTATAHDPPAHRHDRAIRGRCVLSMAEVFVMHSGKIAERRAWVIELKENDYR
jgi:hypothetical protein